MFRQNIARLSLTIAISLLLLLATACRPTPAGLELEAADNGRQISLEPEQRLTITLESNPTTGYSWEIAELDETIVASSGEPVYESGSATSRVGAGGWQTFQFAARQSGTTTLTLIYHRPWETDVAPIDSFSVTITVD